jgi:hypothetical protein
MKSLALAFLILVPCACEPQPFQNNPTGPALLTPKHHVTVLVDLSMVVAPEVVLAWVDERIDLWITYKANQGLGAFTDGQLEASTRSMPVFVWEHSFCGPDGSEWPNTFHNWGSHIDVCAFCDDPNSLGLFLLPFALTKTVLP